MKVFVITFEEGDLGLNGSVYESELALKQSVKSVWEAYYAYRYDFEQFLDCMIGWDETTIIQEEK